MKDITENGEWLVRFTLEAKFPEAYEGDDDGYAWLQRFHEELRPRLVRAVFRELRATPGWEARVQNRGAPEERELEILVTPSSAARAGDA